MVNRLTRPFKKSNRVLLAEMIRTDFKLRYQNSVIGYLWSLLNPLFIFGILYVVFTMILRIGADIPGYPVYLLMGILIWTFFSESTNRGVGVIVGNSSLIRKINIPKYLLVVSNSVSSLINFGLSLIVLAFFIWINPDASVTWSLVPLLVLLIIQLFVFATALSFILSAMFVKFRDIKYIWEVLMRGGFYATPILYPLQIVPERIQKYLFLNPLAQNIQDIRRILTLPNNTTQIYDVLAMPYYLIPFAVTILVVVFAIFYFKKQSIEFAENV